MALWLGYPKQRRSWDRIIGRWNRLAMDILWGYLIIEKIIGLEVVVKMNVNLSSNSKAQLHTYSGIVLKFGNWQKSDKNKNK